MDLVGLLLIGVVLTFGSIYVGWISWDAWREARVLGKEVESGGSSVAGSTRLQLGLTLVAAVVFFSFAGSLCFSIAEGESCGTAVEQLRSLTYRKQVEGGRTWGEEGKQGTLHVVSSSGGERVAGASMAYIDFDNADLEQLIDEYPHIEWLVLSGTQINDQGLKLLGRETNLHALVLTNTSVTDRGVAILVGNRGLRELDLSGTTITDRGLEIIGSMPALQHLTLRQTSVTDDGLKMLAGNMNLLSLNIQETRISDGAVATLASLENLELLHVGNSEITSGAIARLQHALPGCEIDAAEAGWEIAVSK